jgi:hypothetical protein
VQESVLEKYPSEDLRVYSVWLPLPMGGLREHWDNSAMPDARVLDYWDSQGVTGQWFASEVDGYRGLAWDVYYLYGPHAEWDSVPAPLIASGGPVIAERDTLRTEIQRLVSE